MFMFVLLVVSAAQLLPSQAVASGCVLPAFPKYEISEKRVALVIGISKYQSAPALQNTVCDAQAMASLLDSAGFEVIEGYDLDKGGIEDKARHFATAAEAAQVSLFFYAGHGVQVEGTNYLVPADAAAGSVDPWAGDDFDDDPLWKRWPHEEREQQSRGRLMGRGAFATTQRVRQVVYFNIGG